MNYIKTKEKLKKLTNKELDDLINMAQHEKSENRIQYTSNKTHTPREQTNQLQEFFNNAWIH